MKKWLLGLAIATSMAAEEPPKLIAVLTHDAAKGAAVRTALRGAGIHWLSCRTIGGDMDKLVTIAFVRDHAQLATLKPVPGVRSAIYRYSRTMSYNVERLGLSKASAIGASIQYVRRGTTDAYVAEQTLAADLLRKAQVKEEEFIAYALEFGGETPAFLFLTPMRSLADIDIDLSAAHENLFTPEQDQHRAAVLKESVRVNESMLLAVDRDASNSGE